MNKGDILTCGKEDEFMVTKTWDLPGIFRYELVSIKTLRFAYLDIEKKPREKKEAELKTCECVYRNWCLNCSMWKREYCEEDCQPSVKKCVKCANYE